MNIVKKQDTESLGERTYKLISAMILSGDLTCGDPVQERGLAKKLNVSRTPVREAINRLEAEGYVERSCGRVVVREIRIREFLEILDVRKLLECDTARDAAKNINIDELRKVRQAIEALDEKTSVTATELRDADDLFHNFVAEAANNKLMAELIKDLRHKTSMFDHERLPNRLKLGNREHVSIIEALEKGDGVLASARMARHILNVRRSIFEHWKL